MLNEKKSTLLAASPAQPPQRNGVDVQEWKYRLLDKLLTQIDLMVVGKLQEDLARAKIREAALHLMQSESAPFSGPIRKALVAEIEDEIMGLGPLEPLLRDPTVADIMVNGFDTVYVERHGRIERTDARFKDNDHVLNILDRIVSKIGRRVDESSPMVDARLADGSRVNAIIPPLALDGPTISIRRFSIDNLTVDNLIELGSLAPEAADIIQKIVICRLNVLISGGTGSGKTTLLNILSGFIPPRERIITIEDSAELQLQQPHVVRLETRPPNIEGKGQVTSTDLVRNSLRMRPDRIVIGEVRGGEAFDMLQAMNTGHDGSLTTVHANSPRDGLTRIESMVTMTGMKLPMRAIRAQIASAINVVIQTERMEDGKRRVVSIQEIQGMEGDVITMAEIFAFRRKGLDADGNVAGEFCATGVVPKFADQLKRRGFPLDLKMFRAFSR
jgi:pilus assembly protein CpaF